MSLKELTRDSGKTKETICKRAIACKRIKLDFDFLTRKKKFSNETLSKTNLSRVLGLMDICAIGLSSTIGSGIYILGMSFLFMFLLFMFFQLKRIFHSKC